MKLSFTNCLGVSPVSEVCWKCRHFDGENPVARRCAAFPETIPLAIWRGENDHTKLFPGDNGIRFEPRRNKVAKFSKPDEQLEMF